MSAALAILAVVAVSVCQVYAWRFAYKPRLERPPKYEKAKRILNRASAVLVLLAAVFLVVDDAGQWAAALILGSLIVAYFVHGLAYRREIFKMAEGKDPKTGEYLFTGTLKERKRTAKLFIDAGGF